MSKQLFCLVSGIAIIVFASRVTLKDTFIKRGKERNKVYLAIMLAGWYFALSGAFLFFGYLFQNKITGFIDDGRPAWLLSFLGWLADTFGGEVAIDIFALLFFLTFLTICILLSIVHLAVIRRIRERNV